MNFHCLGLFLFTVLCWASTANAKAIEDPLNSIAWETMYEAFFAGQKVVVDELVKVQAPESAEDPLAVPVWVDASALKDVKKIVVIADLNPIPRILEFYPMGSDPVLGFRFKIEQASPIRALVQTSDDVWHMNGVWIDAAGGGCTAPSLASGNANWADRLGMIGSRTWPMQNPALSRLKLQINHPMDTGLAEGIPAYYLETIIIKDAEGNSLGIVKPFEPVSEDPIFSLNVNTTGPVSFWSRDNNGNIFKAELISD